MIISLAFFCLVKQCLNKEKEINRIFISIVVLFTAKTKTYMPKSYFSKGFSDFRNFVVQQNCMIQDVLSSGYDLYVMRNRRIVLRQRWCDRSFLVESVSGQFCL